MLDELLDRHLAEHLEEHLLQDLEQHLEIHQAYFVAFTFSYEEEVLVHMQVYFFALKVFLQVERIRGASGDF